MQELSLTATQQLQALASGKITAVELLEQAIARAEEMAREERDSKRKKEAEALMGGAGAFRGAVTLVAMSIAMVVTLA